MSDIQTFPSELQAALETHKSLNQKITHYYELIGLAQWDLQTGGTQKKGRAARSDAIGSLSAVAFELSVSAEMEECLSVLSDPEYASLIDQQTKAAIRLNKRTFDQFKSIPPDMYKEYVILTTTAHDIWDEAKQTNNFSHYEETLTKIVAFNRQFVEIMGYDGHPYNRLLDSYEPGLTVDQLDPLFSDLREKTIDLLKRIQASPHQPSKDFLNQSFDIEQQKALSQFILPKLGFDLEAGRLDESAHPFATGLNPGDVRLTTHYFEQDVLSALFSTIHECGHGLYEQGINQDLERANLQRAASMGIHESQSRFFENILGRSREFWTYFYPDFKNFFPGQFDQVTIEDFTRAVNTVEPSFIRTEADELTYNLHIMIRYEIEKGLIAGDIEVKDLPVIWNEKMQEYLGIVPPTDTLGVLQDVHWSFGGFGYFPSYSLGNLYAAQITHTMKQQLPDFNEIIARGELSTIREWLRENIHQYGSLYTPNELIERVTGEPLNAKYLIAYFEEKFTKIYKL